MTPDEKKARILIIEDEFIIATDLESRLKNLGYIVCGTAASADVALDLIDREHPDLVMMDIMIKGERDGIETSAVIKEKWGIPVVFLTAYAQKDKLERAKLTLPFGYILKPFQQRDLKVTIEMALYMAKVDGERRKMEAALRESERRNKLILENAFEGIVIIQGNYLVYGTKRAGLELGGYPEEEIMSQPFINFIYPDDRPLVMDIYEKRLTGEPVPSTHIVRLLTKQGQKKWMRVSGIKIEWEGQPAELVFFTDIDELKQAEKKQELLIQELQSTLNEVKTLRGLIPICASCKKIRGDTGYWQEIEAYIQERTEALFTHGICPDCKKKLYPQLYG